jgi:hypothetical protein
MTILNKGLSTTSARMTVFAGDVAAGKVPFHLRGSVNSVSNIEN